MSVSTIPQQISSPDATIAKRQSHQWILSPWFDLLFVMNLMWPILFWIGYESDLAGHSSLQFWQIYFVTTPHRWITLFIVLGDWNRFRERKTMFLSLGAAIVAICLLVRSLTGALTCLLAVDYLWNAWHFASQHHGIYRIYERKANPECGVNSAQKWVFRLPLLYIISRIVGWSWQFEMLDQAFLQLDYAVGGLLLIMMAAVWFNSSTSWAQIGYLTSVLSLYLALLAAVHYSRPDMVLVLSTCSALFHATEYLAVISWNVKDREAKQKSNGPVRNFAPIWFLFLIMFVVVLGVAGWYADKYWLKIWVTLNVIMAFLHYSYDGLIWRRRPAPQS